MSIYNPDDAAKCLRVGKSYSEFREQIASYCRDPVENKSAEKGDDLMSELAAARAENAGLREALQDVLSANHTWFYSKNPCDCPSCADARRLLEAKP